MVGMFHLHTFCMTVIHSKFPSSHNQNHTNAIINVPMVFAHVQVKWLNYMTVEYIDKSQLHNVFTSRDSSHSTPFYSLIPKWVCRFSSDPYLYTWSCCHNTSGWIEIRAHRFKLTSLPIAARHACKQWPTSLLRFQVSSLLTDMRSKYNKCNPFLLIEGVSQVKHDCRANFAARYPAALA